MYALVDWLDTNKTNIIMELVRKTLKSIITTTQHLLETKIQKKSTELSKYIWELKDNNIQDNLKWHIASKAHLYACRSKKCDLCLTGKLTIIKADPETLLNTHDELVSKCRHMNKFTLRHFKKN